MPRYFCSSFWYFPKPETCLDATFQDWSMSPDSRTMSQGKMKCGAAAIWETMSSGDSTKLSHLPGRILNRFETDTGTMIALAVSFSSICAQSSNLSIKVSLSGSQNVTGPTNAPVATPSVAESLLPHWIPSDKGAALGCFLT